MSEILDIAIINGLMYADIKFQSAKERKFYNASMLLDTGASVTTVSSSILNRLGYTTENKAKTVRTANGSISVCEIVMPEIILGSIRLVDVDVHAHTFPFECYFDGILGMNVLSLYNLNIDFDNRILELRDRRDY